MRVMKVPAAGQTDVNLETEQEPEAQTGNALIKLRIWLLKVL